ncbi:hypothetical protein ODJ79_43340 [Actinoplanes sp. KI2]|uniref:hypothetical protein n=1 Tax=Actinoplanes sp. KI2 TaxID=2983315 RepID=UPI0021D57A6D|nr:hypothetical protein [Actinoplanes sp. KI2]MCU7730593.1 hypothetical protein [Actinoplanes sp. KI2]
MKSVGRPRTHREELLRAFRIGPQDIEANRAGRLGPGQIRRLRRNIWINALAVAPLILAVVLLAVLLPHRGVVQYVVLALVIGLFVALLWSWIRGIRRSLRAGVVECLTGPVTVTRSRGGSFLTVRDKRLRLWTPYWHVGRGLTYRVYFAPAATMVVAMEPDGWE